MIDSLKINEIFYSLQGESLTTGVPTIFIRLTGCPLRCSYCDTAYAFHKGKRMSIDEIMQAIAQYRTQYITITGGEPLAQPACHTLMTRLCDQNYVVSLETSGALSIKAVDPRVIKVMDLKTPSSNEVGRNLWDNLNDLTQQDQIKFVITDRNDYDWTKQKISDCKLDNLCPILLSPSYGVLNIKDLATWILEDQLKVRLQIQLHKYIWGDVPGM